MPPGVSTRKVDDLVEALGVDSGISESEVSRICAELDTEVAAFTSRPLDAQATPLRVLGPPLRGRCPLREVLGCDVGDAKTLDFWKAFLGGLRDRGLRGVQLVISEQHRGLVSAIEQAMAGASWLRAPPARGARCRVHFMRNVLT